MMQQKEIFALALIAAFPVLSNGICDYKFTIEPSVFDKNCSPVGIPAMLQCTVELSNTLITRESCANPGILPEIVSFSTLKNDNSDYVLTPFPCVSNKHHPLVSITSVLNITAVKLDQFGYYWCTTQVDNIYGEPVNVHSSMGILKDAVSDCESVKMCEDNVLKLFQRTNSNICASSEPPMPPTHMPITARNCSIQSTAESALVHTTQSTADSLEASGTTGTASGETQTIVFVSLAVPLLLMFAVIVALLGIITILIYKRQRTTTTPAHSTTDQLTTTPGSIEAAEKIDMVFSCKNDAYDSFTAAQYKPETIMATDMHVAVTGKDNSDKDTDTYPPPNDDSASSIDEDYLQMHIYATIGSCGALNVPNDASEQ